MPQFQIFKEPAGKFVKARIDLWKKLMKSEGKYGKAQSLNQRYFEITRYFFDIFNPNPARFCISELIFCVEPRLLKKPLL